jgi:2-polyprenyl-3-methyl-5-hydroxy-6-metoxy-1,4-benzoquinol methylase
MIPQQLERLYLKDLPWELRLLPGPVKQHIERYQFVTSKVSRLKVLDIACGSGYGSDLLAKQAEAVCGVDISAEAINYAKSMYRSEGLTFSVGSAEKLPFGDNTFDVVVSFETIEHLEADFVSVFLSELVRVLKPGGKLFLSSPDNRGLSLGFTSSNPFHVQEFRLDKISEVIPEQLRITEYYGQEFRAEWLINFLRKFSLIVPAAILQRVWRLGNAAIDCSGKVFLWNKSKLSIPLYFLIEAEKI